MDEVEAILDYTKKILTLEYEISNIKNDMKQIKKDAKEYGISVKSINSAINIIKKDLKTSPEDKEEVFTMEELIREDTTLMNTIELIVNKWDNYEKIYNVNDYVSTNSFSS